MNNVTFSMLRALYPRHWEHLRHLITSGTMQHSYCLAGCSDGAQDAFAQSWAMALVCEKNKDRATGDITPCWQCASCRNIDRGIHPDVTMLPAKSLTENLSLDDARFIRQWVIRRPIQSPWTILVLATGEQLRTDVANALLKVLEEPPLTTLIFVVTARAEQLPATLRSRMVPLYIPPVSSIAATDFIINAFPDTPEKRECINLADGRFTRLQALLYPDLPNISQTEQWWKENSRFWFNFIMAELPQREKMLTERFTVLARNKKNIDSEQHKKNDMLAMMNILLMVLRDAFLLDMQIPSLIRFPFLRNELVDAQPKFFALTKKIQLCTALRNHLLHNGNKKMILDYLCVTL